MTNYSYALVSGWLIIVVEHEIPKFIKSFGLWKRVEVSVRWMDVFDLMCFQKFIVWFTFKLAWNLIICILPTNFLSFLVEAQLVIKQCNWKTTPFHKMMMIRKIVILKGNNRTRKELLAIDYWCIMIFLLQNYF